MEWQGRTYQSPNWQNATTNINQLLQILLFQSGINLNKGREVWVDTLMCTQYVESFVDSIIIRDDDFKPIGIVGGYDILDHLRKNPTRDFQYQTKVGEIMFKDLPQIEKTTKLGDLTKIWMEEIMNEDWQRINL